MLENVLSFTIQNFCTYDIHCEPKNTQMFLIYSLQNLTDCDKTLYILSEQICCTEMQTSSNSPE